MYEVLVKGNVLPRHIDQMNKSQTLENQHYPTNNRKSEQRNYYKETIS